MATFRISFVHDYSAWLVIVIAGVSLASAVLFYYRVARLIPIRSLTGLLLLRILALAALLLCLFKPVMSLEQELLKRSALLFLVDDSRSMSVKDFPELPSRLEQVKGALLGNPQLKKLDRDFDLHHFAFSTALKKLERQADIKALQAEGEETKIASAIVASTQANLSTDVSGLILLSDGLDNSSTDPTARVRGLGIPVYTIGVGTRLAADGGFRDLILEDVEVEPLLTVGNVAEVKLSVEALGLAGRVVPTSLADEDGREVAGEKLVLDNLKGTQEVTLKFTPERVGRFVYKVSLPVQSDEQIGENNEHLIAINVVDTKIKLLYLEGTIRAEYKYLLRILQMDPNVELLALLKVQSDRFMQQGSIPEVTLPGLPGTKEELKQFDVVMLGDLDVTHFSPPQLQAFKEMVDEGGGFMMLGGYNSFGPGGYGGTTVEDMLPVLCGGRSVGQEKDPFHLTLTTEGATSPIFSGCERFFPTARTQSEEPTPQLLGCVRFAGMKPGATVLAVNPLRKLGSADLPMLVVQQFGSGRAAAFAADTTWRWYARLRGLGLESPYVKFWGQMVRWLANRGLKERLTEPGIQLFADKAYYEPGEKVGISASVQGEGGKIATAATVAVHILGPGSYLKDLTLTPLADRRGEYMGEVAVSTPGEYQMRATASMENDLLGDGELKFMVARPIKEFDRLDLNEKLLKELAAETGGRYYPLVSIGQLADSLQARQHVKRVYEEKELWNTPGLFALFIALISIEWLLRKRWQLT